MRIRNLPFFRRYHFLAFTVILLFSGLLLITLRVKERQGIAFLDALLLEVCSPLQEASTSVSRAIQGTFQRYFYLVRVEKDNESLKKRVSELQQQIHQMQEMAIANERLRKLLEFREQLPATTISAEVIGRDPSSWFKSITINKGERDNVQKGCAVISPDGVIGQVLRTSPHFSVVLLVTDYNSAIDGIVQRTRAKTIVEGQEENRCQLKYLLRTEDVTVGDVVVTSGLSGKFPKGLVIGEIRNVEKQSYGIFQSAELIPSANLNKLEEVFVISESTLFRMPPSQDKAKRRRVPTGRQKRR